MDRKCVACGFTALVNHDGYTVCEECSTIQKEDHLTSEHQDFVGYQSASENLWLMNDNYKQFNNRPSVPLGLKNCLSQIKNYGILYGFSHDMIESAQSMFTQLFYNPDILHCTMERKLSLSHACLFFVGRQNGRIISLKNFCEVAPVTIVKLVECLKLIKAKLSLELPSKGVIEMTVEIINQCHIKKEVTSNVCEILSICDRAWLLTGRLPQSIIWVAIYIATKAHDFASLRSISFTQFSRRFPKSRVKMEYKRLKEIMNVLTELGEHIPWASAKGHKDFVFYNLNDIIKYSKSAFMEKKRKMLQSMESKECGEEQEMGVLKRKDTGDEDSLDLFQPPSALKRRKTSNTCDDNDIEESTLPHIDTDAENFGSEIEEELDNYLRTDKEVKEIEKARSEIIEEL